jgi:hypothetical protein
MGINGGTNIITEVPRSMEMEMVMIVFIWAMAISQRLQWHARHPARGGAQLSPAALVTPL